MRRNVPAMRTVSDQQAAIASLEARLATLEQMLLDGRWLPVSTVAKRLKVSTQQVRNLIHDGRCPARRWRGRFEVDPAWVVAELIVRSGTCARPVALQQEEVA